MKTIQDVEDFASIVFAYWITLTIVCIIGKFWWILSGKKTDETFSQAAGWSEDALIFWVACFFCFTAIIALLIFQIIVFLKTGDWLPSGLVYLFPTPISKFLQAFNFSDWKGLGEIVFFVTYKIPLHVPLFTVMILSFRQAIIEENKSK